MALAHKNSWRPDRSRNHPACLLVVLAIVAQILMPYTQLAADQSVGDEAEKIVICTSAGLVTYIRNPDGSLQEKPVGPNPSSACEFCQVCQFDSNGGINLVASVPFEFAAALHPSIIANTRIDQQKIQANAGWHPSRAPPGKIDSLG